MKTSLNTIKIGGILAILSLGAFSFNLSSDSFKDYNQKEGAKTFIQKTTTSIKDDLRFLKYTAVVGIENLYNKKLYDLKLADFLNKERSIVSYYVNQNGVDSSVLIVFNPLKQEIIKEYPSLNHDKILNNFCDEITDVKKKDMYKAGYDIQSTTCGMTTENAVKSFNENSDTKIFINEPSRAVEVKFHHILSNEEIKMINEAKTASK